MAFKCTVLVIWKKFLFSLVDFVRLGNVDVDSVSHSSIRDSQVGCVLLLVNSVLIFALNFSPRWSSKQTNKQSRSTLFFVFLLSFSSAQQRGQGGGLISLRCSLLNCVSRSFETTFDQVSLREFACVVRSLRGDLNVSQSRAGSLPTLRLQGKKIDELELPVCIVCTRLPRRSLAFVKTSDGELANKLGQNNARNRAAFSQASAPSCLVDR